MSYRKALKKITIVINDAVDFLTGPSKQWVEVFLNWHSDAKWIPSLEEIFWLVQAICFCEDQKYPNGQGRFKLRDFLKDCCELIKQGQTGEERWCELQAKYNIPERDA